MSLLCATSAQGAQDNTVDEPPVSIVVDFSSGDAVTLRRIPHDQADITIDGRVVEDAWSDLPVISSYQVTEPDTLAEPTYETRLRIFYTERGIYAGFNLEQPASTIVKRHAPRDSFDVNRDTIGINLDSSGSGRYGYWMTLALGDGVMDGTVLPERSYSREWDGAWWGATQLTDDGWSAEFFIPWGQMAMPREQGTRRLAIYSSRKVAHLNERWAWPALPQSQPRFMSLWQPFELDGIDPRQQWSIFPYVSSTFDRVVDENRYKAGVDLFWRPSSNFQGTATVNPDFGAVESDEVIVNLTADEIFFPEKRLFFQEGQEIFETTPRADADSRRKFTIVNTRRIGGTPREPDLPPGVSLPPRQELTVADLFGAAKATGQFGRMRYGLLTAFEDETVLIADDGNQYLQDGRNFGTVRVLYEDSQNAAYRGLGFITSLVAHPEADALVNAVDGHFLSTSGVWKLDGQLIASDRDETGKGYGATLDVAYTPRQGSIHNLLLTYFDDTLDVNDFGFQRRNDTRAIFYRGELIRSGLTRIRDRKISPFVSYAVNGAGRTTSSGVGSSFELNLNNRDKVDGVLAYFPGRYDDRNSFGNGTFKIKNRGRASLNYRTDTSRPISVRGKVGYEGNDLYGANTEISGEINWRPSQNLSVELEVTYMDLDGWLLHQENQNFTTFTGSQWEPEFRVEFFPTAMQQFRVALQWVGIRAEEDRFYRLFEDGGDLIEVPKPPGPTDDFSISSLNFQLRYRWQIAPLSDLFIVYTKADNRETELLEFDEMFRQSWQNPLGDQLVIKLRYRLGS